MCLSTVYEEINGVQNKICEYVSGIQNENGYIKLTDIMGREVVVSGTLKSLDFVKNVIVIEGS